MDLPLSGWGYGPAPFELGIWTGPFPVGDMDGPFSLTYCPPFAQSDATRCIYVYCEIGMLSWGHGDTSSVSAAEHQFLPFMSSDLCAFFYAVEHWRQGVLH